MNRRYVTTLFLFFITILVVKNSFAKLWDIETVFTPEYFTVFYPRAIAVDSSVHPHVVYGGKHLYYAHHDGITWQHETIDTSPQVGLYASIALDTSGNVYISYYDEMTGDLKYATNRSGSWVIEVVDSNGDVGKDTALAIDTAGKVHICYSDSTQGHLKYATNKSGSWKKKIVSMNASLYPAIKVDKSGKVHIGYRNTKGGIEYTTNASGSWITQVVDSSGGAYISLAHDKNDKVYLSYTVNGALKYATNSSGTWVITTVDSIKDYASYTSLRIDKFGKLHIGYYDNNKNLKYATNNTQTGEWEAITAASNDVSGSISLALDLSGKAHISYQGLSGNIQYATNASGTWTTANVDSPYVIGDLSMTIDKSGGVHISGVDSKGHLVYFTNISGSWTMQTVDNGNYSIGYDSIAVDTSGNIHISYYDGTNSDLKYTTNASGSWEITTVDSAGNIGAYTSIAVDTLGKAHISYYDISNTNLKYATNASGTWMTTTVDNIQTHQNSGTYTSIAVDTSGKVHISYINEDFHQLRYATNASDTWEITKVVSSTKTTGGLTLTSIAVGTSGVIHISYTILVPRRIMYATNASGYWGGYIVDKEKYVVLQSNSLACNSVNKVHISYYDATNSNIRYATNVAGLWRHRTVDKGTPGRTSIALDPSGKVHIVYNSLENSIQHAISASLDITPPSVSSTIPASGATDVAIETSISATFTEAMKAESINATTFTLKKDTMVIAGTVTYDPATKTATFKPLSNLDYWTPYTATLSANIKDRHGNLLALDYSWNFTTIHPPCIDPYERNDDFNSAYGPLISGKKYKGKICSTTDKDYFKITVDNPGTINIQLKVPNDRDYDLYLYDSAESEIAYSRNPSGAMESITYDISEAGTYYILVIGYADNYDETKIYTLTWEGAGI